MREAQSGPSNAALPASAKSATHSFSRGRISGRHENFVAASETFSAEIPRFASSTSLAFLYTSQHTSNASSGLTLIDPPPFTFGTSDRVKDFGSGCRSRLLQTACGLFSILAKKLP